MINKKFALLLGIMLMFSFVFVSAKDLIPIDDGKGIIGDGKIDITPIDVKVDYCYDNKFEFKVCDSKNLIDTKIKPEEVVLVKSDGVYMKDKLTEVETKIKETKDSTIYIHKKSSGEVYHVDNANNIPVETELEFYYTKRPNVITHIDKNGNKVKDFYSWEYSWTPASCTGSGEEQVCSTDGYARLTTTLTENSIGSETFPLTFTPSQWLTDNQGYASFDGVDDEVQLNEPINLTSEESYSISLWFNANSYVTLSGSSSNLYSSRYGGTLRGTGFQVVNSSGNTAIHFKMRNDSLDRTLTFTNYNLSKWYYVTGIYNSSNESISLYVDGVHITTGLSATYTNSSSGSAIGGNNPIAGVSEFFNGSIDNVQIFNKSLNQTEISQLYNYGRQTKGICDLITDGQVACYDFDDNSFGDGSGNGNYGTPMGFSSTTPEVNDIRSLDSSDYSLTDSGLFTILNDDYRYNLLDVIFSWRYDMTEEPDYALSQDAALGLADFGTWFKILALMGAVVILMWLFKEELFGAAGGQGY